MILCMRNILLEARPPMMGTLIKLAITSCGAFFGGLLFFRAVKERFYDYL